MSAHKNSHMLAWLVMPAQAYAMAAFGEICASWVLRYKVLQSLLQHELHPASSGDASFEKSVDRTLDGWELALASVDLA